MFQDEVMDQHKVMIHTRFGGNKSKICHVVQSSLGEYFLVSKVTAFAKNLDNFALRVVLRDEESGLEEELRAYCPKKPPSNNNSLQSCVKLLCSDHELLNLKTHLT